LRLFKWSSVHAVYLPEVDEEHRELFRMGEELHQAVLTLADRKVIRAMFRVLVDTITAHFEHEERMMEASAYPGLEWHRRQHRGATQAVLAIMRKLQRGDADAAKELLVFLAGWLEDHTSVTDRMMAAYLRNYGRATLALAS
jgi:hemerythrin